MLPSNLPISIACTLLSNKSEGRNIIPVTVLNVSTIQLMTSPEWPFARHALICDAIENILHFTTFEIGTKQSFRINYRSSGNIKLTVRSAKSEVKSFEFNISLMELVPNFGPNKLNIRAMCLFKSLTQHYFPVHYLFRYNSFSRKSYLILKKHRSFHEFLPSAVWNQFIKTLDSRDNNLSLHNTSHLE